MPNRYERDTAVLFKLEAGGYSVDAVPVAATDAIVVQKFNAKQEIKYVKNPQVRPYMGGSSDLVGETYITGSFEVAMGGSGAAGTVTMWSRFLRSAAFAEAITAATRCDYTLITNALESASMYYYDSGVLKKVLGVRCNIGGFKMPYGGVPMISIDFIGKDGGETAVASPALTLTSWKVPVPINTVNSGLLTFDCTYAAGALVGGTTYPSKGIDLSLGGQLNWMGLLGGEEADLTDRDVTGKITLDLTAAQEITTMGIVKAGTLRGIGLLHGTAAGHKLLVHLPACQMKNPTKDTLNGKRVITYDLSAVPVIGNDEWRIVTL